MTTEYVENPALLALYRAYTASAHSIGARFGLAAERLDSSRPLLVATHGDIAVYLGNGAPPIIESFRLGARGFKELAAISHLGPAVSTLARLKELEPDGDWRRSAETLLDACRAVHTSNSRRLWADEIAVEAFVGREESIARMTQYACVVTERFLERSLDDDTYLSADHVRRYLLEGPADDLPVPMNRIMVATFFLTGMDTSHRLIRWCDALDLPWEKAMVIIAGRQGRPTAGVTRDSNSVAKVINTISRGRLPHRHLLIAPHAPVFPLYDGTDLAAASALEGEYRRMWSTIIATSDLGADMFTDYPRFEPDPPTESSAYDAQTITQMPAIHGVDDWFSLTARLRMVLEDPRQLLSGAVTDYASQQLVDHDNDPRRVVVPGLDGEPYPALSPQVVSDHGRSSSR
ncbi:hypothetical protein SAMN05428985_104547 [Nocardioides sp. YR527]|uniref:DUF5624 domain-containing protein n=1 Tax=Nocardioides sp. YR527 TaxID=1881028 RepID=UPI0008868A01|nr:DUF5624 domain-containing protein [Nocardioides sp. YR527]SDK57074.1 hypothetical protein SAMN05428985_104547 [Nocardioides sp. YR527]